MKTMKRLAKQYGAREVAFRDLPRVHQLAVARYMSVDGEAWELPRSCRWQSHPYWAGGEPNDKLADRYQRYLNRTLAKNLKSHYVKLYGRARFGVVSIPTEALVMELLKAGWPNSKISTLEEFLQWGRKNITPPSHPGRDRWPCILASHNDDVLQDGWNRFHCYVLRGDKTIPCVYYP